MGIWLIGIGVIRVVGVIGGGLRGVNVVSAVRVLRHWPARISFGVIMFGIPLVMLLMSITVWLLGLICIFITFILVRAYSDLRCRCSSKGMCGIWCRHRYAFWVSICHLRSRSMHCGRILGLVAVSIVHWNIRGLTAV